MIKRLSDGEAQALEGGAEGGGKKKGWLGLGGGADPAPDAAAASAAAAKKYSDFWGMFGKALKMGVIEDASNRRRLLPLLRFTTSSSGGNLTSLAAYAARMKPNQTAIYYLVGTGGREELERSPFVEALAQRGYEVIYFTDPLDEYMMGVRMGCLKMRHATCDAGDAAARMVCTYHAHCNLSVAPLDGSAARPPPPHTPPTPATPLTRSM